MHLSFIVREKGCISGIVIIEGVNFAQMENIAAGLETIMLAALSTSMVTVLNFTSI